MLFVLFLVSTSSYLDRNMLGVALEAIKAEFHATDTQLGLLSGASFAVLYVTLGVPVARYADRGRRRQIITGALAVWSVMTVACGLTASLPQLVLARVGVGAGEAGAMAPAQSLIADYFPPSQRGRALSIFMTSVTGGNVLGLAGGGWITQAFGWRAMFLAVGLPGLLLAPLVRLALKEPGAPARPGAGREPLPATLRALGGKRSYLLAVAGMALFFGVAYGPLAFVVPFLGRVHGMATAQAGATYGLCSAVGGLAGALLGGLLTDRLSARDMRWLAAVPAVGMAAVCALYTAAFLAATAAAAVGWLLGGALVSAAVYPPMYALLHAVCGSGRRVTAIALALFVANMVGFGLGPLAVGAVSDLLARVMGSAAGLRAALIIVSGALLPAGLLFAGAATRIRADAEG